MIFFAKHLLNYNLKNIPTDLNKSILTQKNQNGIYLNRYMGKC